MLPDHISRQYSEKGREEHDRIFSRDTSVARGPMLGGEKVSTRRKSPRGSAEDAGALPAASTNNKKAK